MKTDKDAAAKTIYTALKAIDSLKVIFAPFLPFTSQRLHGFFGYETPLFGEQYTEEVTDSGHAQGIGISQGRVCASPAMETQRLETRTKVESTGSAVQRLDECDRGGTGKIGEVEIN